MNNKIIGDMTRDEVLDYIIELDEEKERYERKLIKLQSNWNSLREWLEVRKNLYNSSIVDEYKIILDKMNELEGVDND